jgi:hypothetical protein
MRNLVQPPSVHCDLCDGELRFKLIKPDNPVLHMDSQVFVCAKCGHEQWCVVIHDHYAAHTASNLPPAKVRQLGGSHPT